MSGHMEHDPNCREPISEHTGNEPCIYWVEDEEKVMHHYKRGPQGNMIPDHAADAMALYGPAPKGPIGTVTKDTRDLRDPTEVGLAHLASRNSK